MKRNLPVAARILFLFSFIILLSSKNLKAQSKTEVTGFKTQPPPGWIIINNSKPVGAFSWFRGFRKPFTTVDSNRSYIACNYSAVNPEGTISAWLITPTLILKNGGVVSFLTRTVSGSQFPDRLEVRLNSADTTADVGTTPASTGSFSNLLLSINPTLETGGYPDTGWTKYTITLSGIPGIDTGRIAFRYFVTDGGLTGANSNFIGIDSFQYRAGSLPVTFVNFDGAVRNGQGLLNWSTATETNNKGFDVEKSNDGIIFSSIGFVQGKGTSSFLSSYSFTDPKLLSGNSYYRLKQIDVDGNYNYSSTIKLSYSKFDFSISGNGSANAWLQIQLDQQADVSIQIVSFSGKILQTINKGSLHSGTYSMPLNLKNTASGMYVVKLFVDDKVYSKNIFKN